MPMNTRVKRVNWWWSIYKIYTAVKASTPLAKIFFQTEFLFFFFYVRVCVCKQCVYGCGDRGSRLMDKTGRSRAPRLFDELVGSLVRFIDANFVHVRLTERKETGEGLVIHTHTSCHLAIH